ncbi:hypothetical protein AKJ16_DCAP03389 [Drosera capensis]
MKICADLRCFFDTHVRIRSFLFVEYDYFSSPVRVLPWLYVPDGGVYHEDLWGAVASIRVLNSLVFLLCADPQKVAEGLAQKQQELQSDKK